MGIIVDWARMLAYITATVDQQLLLRNEYLAAENRILRAQIGPAATVGCREDGAHRHRPPTWSKGARGLRRRGQTGNRVGWYRKLVARKFDGSTSHRYPGRPRIDSEVEQLVVRMTKENSDWGYDRIVGAMANLGYRLSDQTVGDILERHGIPPAPKRKRTTTWGEFIRAHLSVLAATDFFTVEVLTLRGLVTFYVLFFIHLDSRRVEIAGVTPHPTETWMKQIARNLTMDEWGFLEGRRYLIHDRDTKFTDSFRTIIKSSDVEPLKLPARSPNLNAYAVY